MEPVLTLGGLLARRVRESGDRPALHFQGETATWSELAGRVWRLARTLIELGLEKGDRVFVMTRRRPEAVESFLAICAAGGRVVPVNHLLPPQGLADLFATFPPRIVILDHALRPILDRAPIRHREGWSVIATDGPGRVSYGEATGGAPAGPLDRHGPDDVAYYNFTSGSTGVPKGALTTQAQIWWNTRAAVEALKITGEDVHLPLFAVFSHPHEMFTRALYTGGSLVMVEQIYPRSLAEAIQRHRVTCILGVATLYRLLLPFARSGRYDLGSLRVPESGGMATDVALNEAFREVVGVPILPVWGSTETTGIALANPPGEPFPLDSIGRPCPYYRVKVMDESGRELPAGATGELAVRGPALMEGYDGDPASTALAIRSGWYHTGDLVTVDADGFFTFRGRRTSMIKVGGLKVFSEEVEAALEHHPMVREAAVVPAADELRGEIHRALLVMEPGEQPSDLELKRFLQGEVAKYKIPKQYERVEGIPRTAGGKVDRRALRVGSREDPEARIRRLREQSMALDLKLLELLSERVRLVLDEQDIQRQGFSPGALEGRIRALLGYNSGPLPDAMFEAIYRYINSQLGML